MRGTGSADIAVADLFVCPTEEELAASRPVDEVDDAFRSAPHAGQFGQIPYAEQPPVSKVALLEEAA